MMRRFLFGNLASPTKPWWRIILQRGKAGVKTTSPGRRTLERDTASEERILRQCVPNIPLCYLPVNAHPPGIVDKVGPSVVGVHVDGDVHDKSVTNFMGSGVVVHSNGTIFTAFDLVANQPEFGGPWIPKGQISVYSFDMDREVAATLADADKDLGIAVLKIPASCKLTPSIVGSNADSHLFVNLEWPPKYLTALVGYIRVQDRGIIHLHYNDFLNFYPFNKTSIGGPIVDYYGHVVGISQKKLPEDDGYIIAKPTKIAMQMVASL